MYTNVANEVLFVYFLKLYLKLIEHQDEIMIHTIGRYMSEHVCMYCSYTYTYNFFAWKNIFA